MGSCERIIMASVFPNDLGISDTIVPQECAKNELAMNIIEDELGDQTRRVAHVIMTSHHCTLPYLIRHFANKAQASDKLTPTDVRGSLIVLQQYRCLVVERPPPSEIAYEGRDAAKNVDNSLLYSINCDMVISRLRTGRIMYRTRVASNGFNVPVYIGGEISSVAKKKKEGNGSSSCGSSNRSSSTAYLGLKMPMRGEIAEMVIEDLLMHGRATLQQVLIDVCSTLEQQLTATLRSSADNRAGVDATDESGESVISLVDEDIKAQIAIHYSEWRFIAYHIFKELIKHRLITRVRRLEAPRQQAFIKIKAVRGPKARSSGEPSAAEEEAAAGRLSGAQRNNIRVRQSRAQADEEEHDNQLPDEMMESVQPHTVTAPGNAANAALEETNQQVDLYAVIEARSDTEGETTAFGPVSEEVLADFPVTTPSSSTSKGKLKAKKLKSLDVNTDAGQRSRVRNMVIESDSEAEAPASAAGKAMGRSRTGSSASSAGDEPVAKTTGPGRKKRARSTLSDEAATTSKVKKEVAHASVKIEAHDLETADVAGDIAFIARKNVLWTVNWEQLIEEERIGTCVKYTRERLKEKAARVVRIILEESLIEENKGAVLDNLCYLQRFTAEPLKPTGEAATCQKVAATFTALDDYTYNELPAIDVEASEASRIRNGFHYATPLMDVSRPIDLMRIINAYTRGYVTTSSNISNHESITTSHTQEADTSAIDGTEKERVLDMSTLRKLLDVLVSDTSLGTSRAYGSNGEQTEYVVNIKAMITTIQRKTITSIARGRYGVQTARLVELMLTRDEWMEQSALGDIAIMPAREAREKLYLLYRDNWIDFREVSKRSDFNPQSTFYFWRMDYNHVKSVVLDHAYRGLLNLRIKRTSLLREAGEKDMESQSLALYKEIEYSEAAIAASHVKVKAERKLSVDASITISDSTGGNGTDTKAAISVDLIANGEPSIATQTVNSAAQALHRGCIVRAEEKRARIGASGSHMQGATHTLGMDVAIGRLDLASHNLDLTIMLLDQM